MTDTKSTDETHENWRKVHYDEGVSAGDRETLPAWVNNTGDAYIKPYYVVEEGSSFVVVAYPTGHDTGPEEKVGNADTLEEVRNLVQSWITHYEQSTPSQTYLEHLDYDDFSTPVLFRVGCPQSQTMIPSYEIGQILDKEFNLERGETFDVASGGIGHEILSNTLWWEYAFDADAVSDPVTILETVQELLNNYNEPPEELTEDQQTDWRNHPVVISDVTSPTEEVSISPSDWR